MYEHVFLCNMDWSYMKDYVSVLEDATVQNKRRKLIHMPASSANPDFVKYEVIQQCIIT